MNTFGITLIDENEQEFHTFRDFGLKCMKIDLGRPEVQSSYQQIPGSSQYVDMLKAIKADDEPILGRRKLIAEFDCLGKMEDWSVQYSKLLNSVNGKELKWILDTDPGFYYIGIVQVESQKANYAKCDYTFTLDAEPYKYEITASTEDWLWDPFDFETGVIEEMNGLYITPIDNSILILEGGANVVPVIYVHDMESTGMTVSHNGKIYMLRAGRNRFPQIRIGKQEVTLAFTGTGTISIEYRRKWQ